MSERLNSLVDRLDLRPGHTVLEVGCGHGVAASLICERLETGRLVAIDRSERMIAAALRRNHAWVAQGRAEFICSSFEAGDFGPLRFDRILASRVALFQREPDRAAALAARWLKPGGVLLSVYDTPA